MIARTRSPAKMRSSGVFQRQVEARGTRVALAAGTAAQLVVDAARFVALGADDVQAAGRDHLVVQRLPFARSFCARAAFVGVGSVRRPRSFNSASRAMPPSTMSVPRPAMLVAMVICPGVPAWATISRFARVLLGVQHFVRQLGLVQHARQQFGILDRGGADQHRLAALVAVLDVVQHRVVLLLRRS